MRLALAMQRPSWRSLLAELLPHEIAEWEAFDELSPFGDPRADLRSAMAAAAICHGLRFPINPETLIPDFNSSAAQPDAPAQELTTDDYRRRHDAMVAGFLAMGAKIVHRQKFVEPAACPIPATS